MNVFFRKLGDFCASLREPAQPLAIMVFSNSAMVSAGRLLTKVMTEVRLSRGQDDGNLEKVAFGNPQGLALSRGLLVDELEILEPKSDGKTEAAILLGNRIEVADIADVQIQLCLDLQLPPGVGLQRLMTPAGLCQSWKASNLTPRGPVRPFL